MFHFASKGGYYLSVAFIQDRPLIEHIRYALWTRITAKKPRSIAPAWIPESAS